MNAQVRPIESQHASLDTLSVTIRALHVNGKQMTLAVFRQLTVAEEVNDESCWGVVRYYIKDEGALWLVHSNNGQLKRRALGPKHYQYDGYVSRLERELAMSKNYLYSPEKAQHAQAALDEEIALVAQENSRRKAIAERDARLLHDLPQLFIAV